MHHRARPFQRRRLPTSITSNRFPSGSITVLEPVGRALQALDGLVLVDRTCFEVSQHRVQFIELQLDQAAQLDELYAVRETSKEVRSTRTRPSSAWSAQPTWVWTAMDPEQQLLLVIDVGTRTLEMAQRGGIRSSSAGTGLRPALSNRWTQGLRHGIDSPFWRSGWNQPGARQRPDASTAMGLPSRRGSTRRW